MQFNFDYELLNVRALYYPGSGLNPQTAFGCEWAHFRPGGRWWRKRRGPTGLAETDSVIG